MILDGHHELAASRQEVWEKLNELQVLQKCIPGCESLVLSAENSFSAVIRAKVGPINAKFNSEITLRDIREPESYTLVVNSKGGAAGMGEGIARVALLENETGTRLQYSVELKVKGKLAQIGSRLINNTVTKLSNEFFQSFATHFDHHGEKN